jgi:hypothetical protein
LFTTIALNVGTAQTGRGQRGIEIDAKEFIALRNIVHFNSANPFKKIPQTLSVQQHEAGNVADPTSLGRKTSDSRLEKSFYSKNPYGDHSTPGGGVDTSRMKVVKVDQDMFMMV